MTFGSGATGSGSFNSSAEVGVAPRSIARPAKTRFIGAGGCLRLGNSSSFLRANSFGRAPGEVTNWRTWVLEFGSVWAHPRGRVGDHIGSSEPLACYSNQCHPRRRTERFDTNVQA